VRIALTCTLALASAEWLLESAAVILTSRDGTLLAPSTFFQQGIWGAYAKAYGWLAAATGLPPLIPWFAGPDLAAKLAVVPRLAAVDLLIAVPAAFVLRACPWTTEREGRSAYQALRNGLATLAALAVGVHLLWWLADVRVPAPLTASRLLDAMAATAVSDGTVVALGLCGAAFLLARLAIVVVEPTRAGLVAASVLGLVASLTLASGAPDSMAAIAAPQASARGATDPLADRDETQAAPARGYNVVLISIDSLRADHVGAYGYERATSPTIDALAEAGTRFEHFYSTTCWTLPAHMSLMTGRSLLRHGVIYDDRSLDDRVPVLAESFARAGYHTAAIVSAPYLDRRYGFDRGFESYDDRTVHFDSHRDSHAASPSAPRLQAAARSWLAANGRQPFFLFLHHWDVHYDYEPGAPYDTLFDPDYTGTVTGRDFYFDPAVHAGMPKRDLEHLVALYDGEIRLVDDAIADLRSALAELGVADRTIIAVTADHGDEFFEHGRKGHHRSLYDEVLRVPFVLYVPGVESTRPTIAAAASLVDVMPTLLGLVGIATPDGLDGIDWSLVAYGEGTEPERAVLAELYELEALDFKVSLRSGAAKIIHHFGVAPEHPRVEAYDLATDPGETEPAGLDTAARRSVVSALARRMSTSWQAYQEAGGDGFERRLHMDARTLEQLSALGYVE